MFSLGSLIVSPLVLVMPSHVRIGACVKEDQLASCTRHGRTIAVFLSFLVLII